MPDAAPPLSDGRGNARRIFWLPSRAGIDMFDCVMPTRAARNGRLFVRGGHINIANAVHCTSALPIEEGCPCEACRRYSRGYLAHLFRAKEILYYRLATLHNFEHYLSLVRGARQAIIEARLPEYVAQRTVRLGTGEGFLLALWSWPSAWVSFFLAAAPRTVPRFARQY